MTGATLCIGGPRHGMLWTSPMPGLGGFDEHRELLNTAGELWGKYVFTAQPFPHWRWLQWEAPLAPRVRRQPLKHQRSTRTRTLLIKE